MVCWWHQLPTRESRAHNILKIKGGPLSLQEEGFDMPLRSNLIVWFENKIEKNRPKKFTLKWLLETRPLMYWEYQMSVQWQINAYIYLIWLRLILVSN